MVTISCSNITPGPHHQHYLSFSYFAHHFSPLLPPPPSLPLFYDVRISLNLKKPKKKAGGRRKKVVAAVPLTKARDDDQERGSEDGQAEDQEDGVAEEEREEAARELVRLGLFLFSFLLLLIFICLWFHGSVNAFTKIVPIRDSLLIWRDDLVSWTLFHPSSFLPFCHRPKTTTILFIWRHRYRLSNRLNKKPKRTIPMIHKRQFLSLGTILCSPSSKTLCTCTSDHLDFSQPKKPP